MSASAMPQLPAPMTLAEDREEAGVSGMCGDRFRQD